MKIGKKQVDMKYWQTIFCFHATEEDLNNYYERVKISYKNIFTKAGIGDQTYLTYASGGTFSKYSHEFQTLTGAGEDYIYICDKCRVAINREILEDQKNKCPECGNNGLLWYWFAETYGYNCRGEPRYTRNYLAGKCCPI